MAQAADDPDGGPPLDLARIVQTLDRHGVEYLLIGGAAALSYGAQRATQDVDCLFKRGDDGNFQRLAAAMRELGARVRAEGLSDEEAKQLPVEMLHPRALGRSEISTWMTDAGGLDILTDMPDRDGTRLTFETLADRAEPLEVAGVRIRAAALTDIIASKEWTDRAKDHKALPELYAIRDAHEAAELAQTCFPDPVPGTPPGPEHHRPGHRGAGPGRDTDLER